jgi:hypothetical protein
MVCGHDWLFVRVSDEIVQWMELESERDNKSKMFPQGRREAYFSMIIDALPTEFVASFIPHYNSFIPCLLEYSEKARGA